MKCKCLFSVWNAQTRDGIGVTTDMHELGCPVLETAAKMEYAYAFAEVIQKRNESDEIAIHHAHVLARFLI